MLIPHQFKNGEPATARDYDLTITYQPHPNFVQEEPPEELVIQAPYEASAKHSEPSLREGNHVTLDQATRSFKEVIDPGGGGGGGTGGFSQMQAYMSDPEYGTTQTITVEVLTPGLFMVLHGPSTHGDTGPEIERPDDDITPYSGLLPKNIDNDREAEPDSPTAVLWDWNRDDLDPTAPENTGDDDFVAIELNFDPSHSATVPGLAGQVELRLPQHTRAFTADGTELTSADLVVDINNPSGPFSELISQGVQLVWIEGSPEFVHSFVEFVYEIIGNAAGMTGPIGDMADLHTLDLDVSGNQQVNQPEDGLTSYLPGYRGDDALLHDDSKAFADLTYTGAQTLHLVIEGAAHLQAEFEIINVSSHPGFAVNTPHDAFGEGAEEDFSFDPDINERHAAGVPAGDHLVVPIYCKDYGGHCRVRVILRDAKDKEIGRTTQWIPVGTRQYVLTGTQLIADTWLIAEGERWNVVHDGLAVPGGDFAPADDTEPQAPHATEGDGLTVFEEYRGFILDGGRDENGPHDGGHRRLSPARKELLVDILEMPNWDQAGGEPAVTNKNFSVADTMHAVAEFYNDETEVAQDMPRGCGIDLHWVIRQIDLGDPLTAGGELPRKAYFVDGEIKLGHANPRFVNGSGYVHKDWVLQAENGTLFNTLYNEAGLGGAPRDHHKLRRATELNHFVRLMLVSRWLQILPGTTNPISGPTSGPAEAAYVGTPWDTEGALIAVSGIREEGIVQDFTGGNHYTQTQFEAILQWAIAHELGHLIIRYQDGNGWIGGHYDQPDAVMTNEHPGLGGINNVFFHEEEKAKINLPGRASVPP